MKTHQIRYQDALNQISEARPYVYPNEGFLKQLKQYEDELFNVK